MSLNYGPEELVPLFSNEAEMSTLGSMVLSERAAEEVKGILRPEDFYRPSHRLIFAAMLALLGRHEPVDLVTLRDELKARGNLADIGGEEYLIQVSEFVPSPANSGYYAGIVLDKATLRGLEEAGRKIIAAVHEQGEDTAAVKVGKAENLIREIAGAQKSSQIVSMREVVKETLAEVDDYVENGVAQWGVKTGFRDLDWKTTGFYPEDLILIAARPAMGKTGLVLQIAVNVAKAIRNSRERGSVVFFSMEMPAKALARRAISLTGSVSFTGMKRGEELTNDQYERMANGGEEVHDLPMFFDDGAGLTPSEMIAKCMKVKYDHGLTMVVVDNIQLMTLGRKTSGKTEMMDEISRELKKAAKVLGCPVVALSQLSRAVEARDDKRPTMADIRDSGQIEANADLVLLLYREAYYKAKDEPDEDRKPDRIEEAEVIIGKQRGGETGKVILAFQPGFTRFTNVARHR